MLSSRIADKKTKKGKKKTAAQSIPRYRLHDHLCGIAKILQRKRGILAALSSSNIGGGFFSGVMNGVSKKRPLWHH